MDTAYEAPWRRIIPALVGLGSLYLVSQFARNALGVIAGDVEAAMALQATQTATLAGSMFLACGAAQIPAAALLSRFGAGRVVPLAAALLALGLIWFARAESFTGLLAARALMGFASAPVLPGAFALFSGFGEARLTALTGLQTAFGRAGVVIATTPLALLVAAIGWRDAFFWAGLGAAAAGVAATVILRSDAARKTALGGASLREGFRPLVSSAAFWAAVLFQGALSAAGSTILGLWGGPWLANVYGMDVTARGLMLLAMALAWFASAPLWGRLATHASGKLMAAGAAIAAAALLGLAALVHIPTVLLLPWLALLGAATGPYPVVLTKLRKLIPPGAIVHLSTLLTAGTMVLVFAVQVTTGLVEDQFDGAPGRHPEEAYQAVFALLALTLLISVAAYWAAVRPRRR